MIGEQTLTKVHPIFQYSVIDSYGNVAVAEVHRQLHPPICVQEEAFRLLRHHKYAWLYPWDGAVVS